MSLRLADEHRIVLRPDRIVLARVKRDLTRQGVKRHVDSMHDLPCAPATGDDLPWTGALRALEANFRELYDGKSRASVVLSNHFVRYALVPWNDALNDAKEEMAYAQHSFSELYGRDGREWEVRVSPGNGCTAQVASAVDARLLGSLREVLGRCGVRLKSIQPHLMHACNACHVALRERSAWLALVEHGNLCLALLHKGRWSWVRSMRIGDHWEGDLPHLLERESINANVENGVHDVLVWTPEHEGAASVSGGRWKFQNLQPAVMPSLNPEIGARFAKYLSE